MDKIFLFSIATTTHRQKTIEKKSLRETYQIVFRRPLRLRFRDYTVITASSCKEQLVHTYVRIKMKLNSGTSIETVVTELSMIFYDLLHELEKAQKSKHNEIKIILYQNKNKWKNDVNKVKMKYNIALFLKCIQLILQQLYFIFNHNYNFLVHKSKG